MSLPAELRTLCHLLSSTESFQLPYITPTLLKNVLCCGEVLSVGDESGKTANSSEHLVLVHKFKTQLTTLLNGKTPGGRFAAVVLIKAVVEQGGWETLRGSEAWVKGLLLVLAKPDTTEIKSICILTLVSIYALTHQYQTLVREITTPTLPTFVTSCLNLVPKSTSTPPKNMNGQERLIESIFEAFSVLIPRHPTIFRPFTSQIRLATRLYLAPTMSDEFFVPPSLRGSARRLAVVVHQTAAKNSAGDEWAKALQSHIKALHVTADQVFRAVIEDWESVSGHVSKQIDMNATVHGGSESVEDLPEWSGIFAGVERLAGLLAVLAQYLKSSTAAAVSIPVGAILDSVTRMLSLAKPNGSTRDSGSARINPAVDRDEREGLWAGLPQIHVASMQLLISMIDRLQTGFVPLSRGILDQVAWLFPFGRQNEEFRTNTYFLTAKLLCCGGSMLPKDSVSKLSGVVLACCRDLLPAQANAHKTSSTLREGVKNVDSNGSNSNADTFLQNSAALDARKQSPELGVAAHKLLPLLLSHVPQAHLGFPLRSLIDRTAIITKNKDAMLTSVLSPFPANGHAVPSILPYLSRQFPEAPEVESLLRPRLPILPLRQSELSILNAADLEYLEESTIGGQEDNMDIDTAHNDALEPAIREAPQMSSMMPPVADTAHEKENTESMVNSTAPVPVPPKGSSSVWTNVHEAEGSVTLSKSTLNKRSLPVFDRLGSASEKNSEPTPKRGKFNPAVAREESQALSTHTAQINITQPVVDQNTSGDMEEDSDDESVPSLKMEFDSSSEE